METISSKDKKKGIKYIAFFDLDHTIINTNSGKAFIQYAYNKGLMTRIDLIKGIYLSFLYKLNLKDTLEIIGTMVSWVKGASEDAINELSSELFKNHLVKSIHREVQTEITFHKEQGARVVILSSAILPVCNEVAAYLTMDDVICSNLESINGVYTGRPVEKFCFGEEKVTRLMEYCNKNKVNPADSWYYGDSIADLPALSSVGNPVCINPDKKLKRAARKRGWPVFLWS